MIIVNNIKLDINQSHEQALAKAEKILGLKKHQIKDIHLRKISTDARKGDIKFVCSVAVELFDKAQEQHFKNKNKDITIKEKAQINFLVGDSELTKSPIICGFGPAGLFCALVLARMGFKPVVLEQGEDIDTRTKTVKEFEQQGKLNTRSNIQFGEGGAGTFSDGKLTTRISDERCSFVTDTFIQHGAPVEINYQAKPHIGTDLLTQIIKNIRLEIISLGGQVLFNTRLEDIKIDNSKISRVITDKGEFETDLLIMATGHSSRDVFYMLRENQVNMDTKPFSVGVRIEHLQSEIDKGLYRTLAGHKNLSQGEYQLNCKVNDRGVYTFCMCPGGNVVAAASEDDTVVVNGMSNHARDGKNANSALVVSVSGEDFDNDFTKAIDFQRKLEYLAFVEGGSNYNAPIQTVDNFLNGKKGANVNTVTPTYPIGVTDGDFNNIFPEQLTNSLKQALPMLDRKLNGFAKGDSILTAVETRTSSPVKINRDENFQSNVVGLFPCGEGAGYAGGIMSAAVDGVRVAQFITENYKPKY